MAKATGVKTRKPIEPSAYTHPTQELPLRPEVGTQPQFKKKKPAKTYRYDSSLAPELNWDGQNPARELGEWLLATIDEASRLPVPADPNQPPFTFLEPRRFFGNDGKPLLEVTGLQDAVDQLKRLSRPFLNWSGKAERLSFDVPTLPLFVHERLSTQVIIETLRTHEKEAPQADLFELFGDPRRSVRDQVVKAYEYKDKWVNRLILGDSLVVMNSLLEYEGLGGQVQMIYIDPPYGIRFGSNFQPFVKKPRNVEHNDDNNITREPEMVRAYRDTWQLGEHSFLTYLRDRFLLARELLTKSGSLFVQISDDNLHNVRHLLGSIFGPENFIVTIPFKKKGGQRGNLIDPINDYIVWIAKDIDACQTSYSQFYMKNDLDADTAETFNYVELPDGRIMTLKQISDADGAGIDYRDEPRKLLAAHPGARLFASTELTNEGYRKNQSLIYHHNGQPFDPGLAKGNCWKHTARTDDGSPCGMDLLAAAGRLFVAKSQLRFKRYLSDFGYEALSNWWDGVGGAKNRVYVVQTNEEVIKRCMLMTTKPGDLVLDPTCGGGTTSVVAEEWGRRWITIDASRVPLSLTRQRLLTRIFPFYRLMDDAVGPAGGFCYSRRLNRDGEEVGGIVPHITSSTIANSEPPTETVIVDRPDDDSRYLRVTGPFVVEASIPRSMDFDAIEAEPTAESQAQQSYVDRMTEVLRKAPIIRLAGNRMVELKNVRPPTRSLALHAEAMVEVTAEGQKATLADAIAAADEQNIGRLPLSRRPVAIVFGPENGAVTEAQVYASAREAFAKSYSHLYVIGFAIQPNAQKLVEECEDVVGLPATWIPATPDLMMGDLLKNMRSSQIFAVAGRPDVRLSTNSGGKPSAPVRYQVELRGLDTFDPVTMAVDQMRGDDVPCWMLDPDYNGLVFHGVQVFFPRTGAWNSLKTALHATHDPAVWDYLAGTTSAPFEAGEHRQIAVKVIDDRGNELMVVKKLDEPS